MVASAKRLTTEQPERSYLWAVRLPVSTIVAALLGLAAAWIAAGSTGLLGHPLRHGLSWVTLGACLLVGWPEGQRQWLRLLAILAAVVCAVPMLASPLPPVNVAAVALVLAALAFGQKRTNTARAIGLIAQAVAVLAVFRLACGSTAWFWLAADATGELLGRVGGLVTGRELWVGATFAGLDVLVTMLYLAVMAPRQLASPNRPQTWGVLARQTAAAVSAVIVVQIVYLAVLAVVGPSNQVEPSPPVSPTFQDLVKPLPPTFAEVAHHWIPWNLPALAGLLQLVAACGILWWRWGGPRAVLDPPDAAEPASPEPPPRARRWLPACLGAATILLATLLPAVATYCPPGGSLEGKKIVLFEKGFLNWLRPEHGQYGRLSIGMYGTMPDYLRSLGAEPLVAEDLSEADLDGASALILFFPNETWEPGQLERIEAFVRDGGTLAVFGEHTVSEEKEGGARFNDVLRSTAMRVRFDSATFAVGGWLQSYEALAHPTTSGIDDNRNEFGVVIGASVEADWPARPLLVGRYGWADPGDESKRPAMMGNHLYDGGDKLGDLILAAEQPLGKGRVIVFGDTSGMTNGLTIGCHRYTSRLLTYMASTAGTPSDDWRQGLALAMVLGLAVMLVARPPLWSVATAVLAMAVVLVASTEASYRAWNVIPDGWRATPEKPGAPNNLAYIDASHAGAYTPESWRDDGTMGLAMTLMRNGYLTLMLPELTRDRLLRPEATAEKIWDPDVPATDLVPAADLLRAGVLVSVAPMREFSSGERRLLRDFVRSGGIFIATVGYEEFGPSRSLLAGTRPLPLSPWGKDLPAAGGKSLGDTEEYRWKYEQVFGQTNNEAVADSLATRFAAQFDRLKNTEEYRRRYDTVLDEIRARNLAQLQAGGPVAPGDIEPRADQRAWGKEYATTAVAQFAEPYGDEVGFGFYVGALPAPPGDMVAEPEPLGHFKSPYFRGKDYESFVRFHAAWPVYCDFTGAMVISEHSPGSSVIMLRRYGRGLVAVVGDTAFAMNKNLEHEGGEPFEGMRENADFWRWFLSMTRGDEPPWTPPRPENLPPAETPPSSGVPSDAALQLLLPPDHLPPLPGGKDQPRGEP